MQRRNLGRVPVLFLRMPVLFRRMVPLGLQLIKIEDVRTVDDIHHRDYQYGRFPVEGVVRETKCADNSCAHNIVREAPEVTPAPNSTERLTFCKCDNNCNWKSINNKESARRQREPEWTRQRRNRAVEEVCCRDGENNVGYAEEHLHGPGPRFCMPEALRNNTQYARNDCLR